MSRERIIVGCMSGTSLDGVDAVKVKIRQSDSAYQVEVLEYQDNPFLFSIQQELKHISLGEQASVQHLLKLQQDLSKLHIEAIQSFKKDYELIVVHGQTIFHSPPLSWQMIEPHMICAAFNTPVLYDLRSADLARGGQGAPISPLADALIFQSNSEKRAIINLGGFINITILEKDTTLDNSIHGFDLCICNQWLDKLTQIYFQKPFDKNGEQSLKGNLNSEVSDLFYQHFKLQWQHQRSLGSKDDQHELLEHPILKEALSNDILFSYCDAVGKLLAEACSDCDRLILAGGGCHNPCLVQVIQEHSQSPVQLSDVFGVPFQQREAILMALLGELCLEKRPITSSNITQCSNSSNFLSGSWVYP